LFRGSVALLALPRPEVSRRPFNICAQTKVHQPDPSIGSKNDVLGRDVSMHQTRMMHDLEDAQNLVGDLHQLRLWEGMPVLTYSVHVDPLHILEYDIRFTLIQTVMDCVGYARVLHPAEAFDFISKGLSHSKLVRLRGI